MTTDVRALLYKQSKAPRYQAGCIYESSNRFYVKYRVNGKRVSRFLCDKDATHTTKASRSVKLLRDEVMKEVNAGSVLTGMTVDVFWKREYLPFLEEHRRHSTVKGYLHLWERHVKDHLTGVQLDEYTTPEATAFLSKLAGRRDKATGEAVMNRNSLAHVRNLLSGIFSHALALGYVKLNPIAGAKVLGKIREPKDTQWYTLAEVLTFLNAPVADDLKVMVSACFFLALRPSELIALSWQDVDLPGAKIKLQRSCVRGHVERKMKTATAEATLPLIGPLHTMLSAWHEQAGRPHEGYIFPNHHDEPLDVRDLVVKRLRPAVRSAGLTWRGLYAFRRGSATAMVDLTGNLVAAQELLRHKSLVTTAKHYKKRTEHALVDGMKLLEAETRRT